MFRNLEAEMARAGMTQNKLAEIIGVTATTLSLKLNGKTILSLKECTAIKKALETELPIDYLFESKEIGEEI